MPPDYYAGVGKAAYAKALDSEKGIFNPTGIMPADGPKTASRCSPPSTRPSRARPSTSPRPTPTSSSRPPPRCPDRALPTRDTPRAVECARHTPARASRRRVVRSRSRPAKPETPAAAWPGVGHLRHGPYTRSSLRSRLGEPQNPVGRHKPAFNQATHESQCVPECPQLDYERTRNAGHVRLSGPM